MGQRPDNWLLLRSGCSGKISLRVKDIDWVTVESNDPGRFVELTVSGDSSVSLNVPSIYK